MVGGIIASRAVRREIQVASGIDYYILENCAGGHGIICL